MAEKVMSNLQEELLRQKAEARRPWWWMVGIFGVLFLVLGVLAFKDVPPPDDAWMLPEFTPGGGPQNALAVFLEEMKHLPPAGTKPPIPEVRDVNIDKMEDVRRHLKENAAHLALYDELMKTQTSDWRWPDERDIPFLKKHRYLTPCIKIHGLIAMRAKLLAREGKKEESLEEAIKSIRFAQGLSQAEGVLIDWVAAITSHRTGVNTLEKILTWSEVDEDFLKRAQEAIASLPLNKDDYLLTLKADYLYSKHFAADLKSGEIAFADLAIKVPWWARAFYQPNRSLEMLLNSNKPVVQALSRDWAGTFVAMRDADAKVDRMAKKPWSYLLSPNAAGNYLMLGPDRWGFLTFGGRTIQNEALFRQTLIVIAIRRFELAHGKLPTRLEELAPQYLAEVPTDPFDNKPMRWNFQTNVVYSVGEDLKDDAGKISRPSKMSDGDVGLHYFWKLEKAK